MKPNVPPKPQLAIERCPPSLDLRPSPRKPTANGAQRASSLPVSPSATRTPAKPVAPSASGNSVEGQTRPFRLTRFLSEWIEQAKSRLTESVRSMPNESISFLTSTCIHILLILLLALITWGLPTRPRPITLLPGEMGADEIGSVQFDSSGATQELESADSEVSPVASLDSSSLATDTVPSLVPSESDASVPWSTNEILRSEMSSVSASTSGDLEGTKSSSSSLFLPTGAEGRSARRGDALRLGATAQSEAAVEAALRWFAAHQLKNGSWDAEMSQSCNSQCRNGTIETGRGKEIASTGLALLCFLGAGQTHREGNYKQVVEKGLYFLVDKIQKTDTPKKSRGRFLDDDASYEMYEQGIAVLALCEAYQMTQDSHLRYPCEVGIEFIQKAQHADGSWGYRPNVSGDLSIVGWQIMALKSAAHIGFKVKKDAIERADSFLTSQQSEYGAYYGYRSTQREPCTTSIGLLLRLYRGWSRTDPNILKGMNYIADLGPSIDGVYYNYYATQLLYHMKTDRWENWNRMTRDYLVKEQATNGHERGSWYFGRNHFNQVGGRLYNTAMATLTLEVYYRHMPIYDEIDRDAFAL